jgi:integrase/recombinase XerC
MMPRTKDSAPWDAPPARLRVVRGPREDGCYYWRAVVREEGKPRQVWAGWGRRLDPQVSGEVRRAIEGERAEAKAAEIEASSVRHLLGLWKGYQHDRHAEGAIETGTRDAYDLRVRRLSRGIGDTLIELDRDVIGRFQRDRLAAGGAPSTVTADILTLSFAWQWGREQGHAPDRDLALPDPPKPKRVANDYTPTADEVLRTIGATLLDWHRAMLVLLFATGARVGEIAAVQVGDIDLTRGLIEVGIYEGAQKTGVRVVPLSDDAIRELRRYGLLVRRGPLFEPGADDAIRSALKKITRRAGVPLFSPHGLRRLACDTLYESEDPGVAGTMLGHSPIVAMQHYRRARPERLRQALTRSGMGRIPEGKAISFASQTRVSGGKDDDGHE